MRSLPLVLTALVLPLLGAQAQNALPAESHWDVEWTSPEGYLYTADFKLQVSDHKAEGAFLWKLRTSPRAEEQAKIGLTGVEHIRGSYDPAGGVLAFEGYRLEDPNGILGMDRYRVLVAPNGNRMTGLTEHGDGSWTGALKGVRK